jgi:hypothetical protein
MFQLPSTYETYKSYVKRQNWRMHVTKNCVIVNKKL